ncbi:hypothetical protein [Pseudomonas aeruginosa]|nr:hypothetical protein [Pseudomonas aeruginosa]
MRVSLCQASSLFARPAADRLHDRGAHGRVSSTLSDAGAEFVDRTMASRRSWPTAWMAASTGRSVDDDILATKAGGLVSIAKSDNADSAPPLVFDGIFHGINIMCICIILILQAFFFKNTIEWE